MGYLCLVLFYSVLKKIVRKVTHAMAFNSNCSTKPSNITLLLEKKQMLTWLSKLLSEFPQLKGLGLITHVNNPSHT